METTVDIEQGAIVADGMNGTHDPATDVGSMTDELKNNAPHFMDNVLKLRSGNRYSKNPSHRPSFSPLSLTHIHTSHTHLPSSLTHTHTGPSLNRPYLLVQAPKS